ncbi:helix-turn-helix domain-containing protein [uncultured Aquimarina sp.]|uniref:helix-turn-helix domain-containing protein n=1 Tax=uncultured Aquimarina sp. TaxID=575652 RepID=UPI00262F06FD|nr:helix-turn-helix domain-containing protein [uncultured Aquimarina sp.]
MNSEVTLNLSEFFLQIITAVLIIISILFSFFLITVRTNNKLPNILLALYLLIGSLDISSYFYNTFSYVHPIIDMLRHDIAGFLERPLLYLFVISILYSDFKIRFKHLWHLVPLLLSTIVLFPRFYLSFILGELPTNSKEIEGSFTYILATFQRLGYIIATFLALWKYKRIMYENYSSTIKDNYNWLFQMNVILTILFVATVAKNIYKFSSSPNYMIEIRLIILILILAFTCWLILKALLIPKMFRGIDSKIQLISTLVNSRAGENYNHLESISKKINSLKLYMEEQKPFLNPNLTIKELASDLDMTPQELSILINHHIHKNFYEFINDYRIEVAKKIFQDPNQKKTTILEILYEVGFNSKSSFNSSFKKHTGLTPTSYRKQYS